MNFYHWHSLYDIARKHRGEEASPKEFYDWKGEKGERGVFAEQMLEDNEADWYDSGQPYYNVHPAWVDQLSKSNLDKIPSECFTLPHGYTTISVRFAAPHAELTLDGPITMEVAGTERAATWPKGLFVQSILIRDLWVDDARLLYFCVDFGTIEGVQQFGICLEPGISLERAISSHRDAAAARQPENADLWKVLHNLLRVVAMVGFLSEGNPELIDFDVLSKYRDEYPRADQARREVMISKSKQRGKNGWNVGNDMMFLGEQPTHSQPQGNTGRELNYAHIRNGHPHAFRYGPGRTQVKIKWVLPTVVRPDKPFKK